MALTGMEIFKLLPKTNCQECGVQTCLAFAMKLAAGQAELDSCPYITDEAREKLDEASAPPIRPVTIGSGSAPLKIGGETVMYRHEKTFVNKPGIGLLLTDTMSETEIKEKLNRFTSLSYERVGLTLRADILALKCLSNSAEAYLKLIDTAKAADGANFVFMCTDPDIMQAALKAHAALKPLLYCATAQTIEAFGRMAVEHSCPVAVRGESLADIESLTQKLTELKLKDIVIDTGARSLRQCFQDHITLRRCALVQKFRPFGFPTIVLPCEMTDDPVQEALFASAFIPKYGGMLIMSDLQGHNLFPLTLQRMNIYTDPQRPMATSEGIYEINSPDENSPVLVTSNFSLTYFIVSGEIESSRVPTWLLIKDSEGLSVLTAWAAGKFVADAIAPFINKSGIADKVKHRRLIIPGAVATISGELAEDLNQEWDVQIGPREAAHLTPFLKSWKAAS